MAPMTFPPDEPWCIVGRPLFRAVGDEVFVLMPDSRVHWLKNATAKALWEALVAAADAGLSPAEGAALLARGFEVTPEDALADVLAFMRQLADRNLVAPASNAARPARSD